MKTLTTLTFSIFLLSCFSMKAGQRYRNSTEVQGRESVETLEREIKKLNERFLSYGIAKDDAVVFGQELFEALRERNIGKLDELILSYDLYIGEVFDQHRLKAKETGVSEEEIEVALNEMRRAIAESGEAPRNQFIDIRENLKKACAEFLDRGLKKGIAWENTRFIGFKYKSGEVEDVFLKLQNAELFFSHKNKKFSLKIGELIKLQGKYYASDIEFRNLFR